MARVSHSIAFPSPTVLSTAKLLPLRPGRVRYNSACAWFPPLAPSEYSLLQPCVYARLVPWRMSAILSFNLGLLACPVCPCSSDGQCVIKDTQDTQVPGRSHSHLRLPHFIPLP